VVDNFINAVGDTLEQGDVVILVRMTAADSTGRATAFLCQRLTSRQSLRHPCLRHCRFVVTDNRLPTSTSSILLKRKSKHR